MNSVENYEKIICHIFNEEISLADKSIQNLCIDSLNGDDFSPFKNNFIEMLQRLKNYFETKGSDYSELKTAVKEISQKIGYNWSGRYSELVALDFWLLFKDIRDLKYVEHGNVDKMPDSIVKQIGKTTLDVDLSMFLQHKKIYIDIKSYKSNLFEFTDYVIEKLKNKYCSKPFLISPQKLSGGKFLSLIKDFANERNDGKLLEELKNAITNSRKELKYHCCVQ